jgi:predicted RNase H-like HicB family nuclease
MPLMTIVEAYIVVALRHALAEELEDSTYVATIPELPGLIAYGADVHECACELYRLVGEVVKTWLVSGYHVPVIDGVDLNSEKAQILASYHLHHATTRVDDSLYGDEDALEAAFEARRKSS